MKGRDRRATRAVRRLQFDRDLRAAFRDDPLGTLTSVGLDERHVEAVKAGGPASLAAIGVDVRKVDRPPLGVKLRARVATVAAAVFGLVSAVGAPAFAVRRIEARRFGARFVRADARFLGVRADTRTGRRFARFDVRADVRFVLLPCSDLKCTSLEVLD